MSIKISKGKDKYANRNGSRSFLIGILVFIIFGLVLALVFQNIHVQRVFEAYSQDDRISYVKLDPNGNWTVERSDKVKDDFYMSTVNASLKRLLTKCFSSRNSTISNDWAVCRLFLSKRLAKDFVYNNYLVANGSKDIFEYVSKLNECRTCPEIKAEVVDHDHKNSIPTSFSNIYGEKKSLYETLFYIDLRNIESNKSTRVVVNATWSFMSLKQLNSLDDIHNLKSINDAVVESPLGIYFEDWNVVEDKNI